MIVTPEKLDISISEWECYDNSHTRTPQSVVDTINAEFSRILNTSTSPRYAQSRIYHFLSAYSDYGFSDSECHETATNVINKYYNSNINRWEFLSISL